MSRRAKRMKKTPKTAAGQPRQKAAAVTKKTRPGVPRRPGLATRTANRRPCLTVTHTSAVVESKLRFDRAEPSRSCSRDTAAAGRLRR
jgi:hypothetical protein